MDLVVKKLRHEYDFIRIWLTLNYFKGFLWPTKIHKIHESSKVTSLKMTAKN